jgi:hypothetical protein
MKGIIVQISESGVGRMVTVSHKANICNKSRGDPELLRCVISSAKLEQRGKTGIAGAWFSEK